MPNLIPHLQALRRRYGGWPASPTPAETDTVPPYPAGPLLFAVDLFMFGNWVELPGRLVYQRAGVSITRGQPDEASATKPTSIRLQLNNQDGRFSPRNPLGLFYGQIGRSTPLRVRVGNDIRATGEVVAWPSQTDGSHGGDVWVDIEAAGWFRRLSQASALKSALRRAILSQEDTTPDPLQYWPMEDATGAPHAASAIPRGAPLKHTAAVSVSYGGGESPGGSDPLPTISPVASSTVGDSDASGPIPAPGTDNRWTLQWVSRHVSAGVATQVVLGWISTGTLTSWTLLVDSSTGVVTLNATGQDGATYSTGTGPAAVVDGQWHLFEISARPDVSVPTSAEFGIWVDGVPVGGDVRASTTVGHLVRIRSLPAFTGSMTGDEEPTGLGHIAAYDTTPHSFAIGFPAFLEAMGGYAGETAGNRMVRLCGEEGVPLRVVGDPDDTTPMGPQPSGKLLTVLQEAADTDMGVLYEPRDEMAVAFRTRTSMYNQPAAVALVYDLGDLFGLSSTDDDQQIRNDVTVTRPGGSSVRVELEYGGRHRRPWGLSTEVPGSGGIGRLELPAAANPSTESGLGHYAGYLLHRSTIDKPRFPQVGVHLGRQFADAGTLRADCVAVDAGDRVVISGAPIWLSYGASIDLLAVGFEERINRFEWTVGWNCAPGEPWQVPVYGEARYSSDGSVLAAGVDTSTTSLSVATVDGPLWSTSESGYSITVNGEEMTVGGVSGASSPQTFTVVRAVNGVARTHAAGDRVELTTIAHYAL